MKQPSSRTLIAFVDRWGAHFGGINSFNLDLIKAFAAAFYAEVQTVCVVVDADDAAMESVANTQVRLVPLYLHGIKKFPTELEGVVWEALQRDEVQIHPQDTVWLGHDRVTGGIALAAAKKRGGRSALIHHMSFSHYEAFAETSALAKTKEDEQKQLFKGPSSFSVESNNHNG